MTKLLRFHHRKGCDELESTFFFLVRDELDLDHSFVRLPNRDNADLK